MLFKVLEPDELAQGDSVYRKTKTESKRAFWNIPPLTNRKDEREPVKETVKEDLKISEETKDSGVVRGNQQIWKCLKNAYTSSRLLTEIRLLDLAVFLVPDGL